MHMWLCREKQQVEATALRGGPRRHCHCDSQSQLYWMINLVEASFVLEKHPERGCVAVVFMQRSWVRAVARLMRRSYALIGQIECCDTTLIPNLIVTFAYPQKPLGRDIRLRCRDILGGTIMFSLRFPEAHNHASRLCQVVHKVFFAELARHPLRMHVASLRVEGLHRRRSCQQQVYPVLARAVWEE
jgi:hypothetical protein